MSGAWGVYEDDSLIHLSLDENEARQFAYESYLDAPENVRRVRVTEEDK